MRVWCSVVCSAHERAGGKRQCEWNGPLVLGQQAEWHAGTHARTHERARASLRCTCVCVCACDCACERERVSGAGGRGGGGVHRISMYERCVSLTRKASSGSSYASWCAYLMRQSFARHVCACARVRMRARLRV